MKTNIIMFDKPYSADEIAEGRAIQWAVVSGACNRCQHKRECENNSKFKYPPLAPCTIKKYEFLRSDKQC